MTCFDHLRIYRSGEQELRSDLSRAAWYQDSLRGNGEDILGGHGGSNAALRRPYLWLILQFTVIGLLETVIAAR